MLDWAVEVGSMKHQSQELRSQEMTQDADLVDRESQKKRHIRYRHWTKENWGKFMARRISVWSVWNTKKNICFMPSVKHGAGKVMAWRCFCGERVIHDNMDLTQGRLLLCAMFWMWRNFLRFTQQSIWRSKAVKVKREDFFDERISNRIMILS